MITTNMRHLVILFLLVLSFSAQAQNNDCFTACMPIEEKDLLDPDERWPFMREVNDSVRDVILTTLSFVDSTGAALDDIEVFDVITCAYEFAQAKGITMKVIFIDVDSKEEDQYIYLLTYKGDEVAGRLLAGQLQTSCESTFIRACSLMPDGTLRLQQLEHIFDCSEDAFVETRVLPSFRVTMLEDGTFDESIEEDLPMESEEPTPED